MSPFRNNICKAALRYYIFMTTQLLSGISRDNQIMDTSWYAYIFHWFVDSQCRYGKGPRCHLGVRAFGSLWKTNVIQSMENHFVPSSLLDSRVLPLSDLRHWLQCVAVKGKYHCLVLHLGRALYREVSYIFENERWASYSLFHANSQTCCGRHEEPWYTACHVEYSHIQSRTWCAWAFTHSFTKALWAHSPCFSSQLQAQSNAFSNGMCLFEPSVYLRWCSIYPLTAQINHTTPSTVFKGHITMKMIKYAQSCSSLRRMKICLSLFAHCK